MTTVRLTVNGEPCSADVAGRTQLAELLRDHLHLTGTHLGCEHGVCGACTVLVDGKPIRSCITYSHACEGANVVTVEGLGDDPTGRALREAFARHHALQCGFCTPGMLIAAWDIVTRLAPVDEAEIRHELSGNLCRCTGYMGIVAAVRDVARQHRAASREGDAAAGEAAPAGDETAAAEDAMAHSRETDTPAGATARGREPEHLRAAPAAGGSVPPAATDDDHGETAARPSNRRLPPGAPVAAKDDDHGETAARPPDRRPPPGAPVAARDDDHGETAAPSATAFEPFEVDPIHLVGAEAAAGASGAVARPMTQTGGWTLVEREFVIGHPMDALWALFEDVPHVAECLPGVHVESVGPDRFAGRAEIRFGPVGASFRGEGTRNTDAGRRTGVIAGHGSDRRGHANLEAELRYAMSGEDDTDTGPRTRVDFAIRFRIQGGLAQFNRSDLVESFADVMLTEFAGNCERRLAGEEVRAASGASGFTLLWRMIRAKLGL